jgi:lysophospholipase L1-like esterase
MMTIDRTDRVHFTGDSITAFGWGTVPGGLVDQIQARWKPIPVTNIATVSGPAATVVGAPAVVSSSPPQLIAPTSEAALVGAFVANIAANVPFYITNSNPTKVFLLIGINDADHGTAPAAFLSSYQSILSQVASFDPSIVVGCLSLFCSGELWRPVGSGGPWGLNAADANIASLNSQIQAAAAGAGQPYIDLRDRLGTWETTHNGASPGAAFGVATAESDNSGVHPGPVGQTLMGQFVLSQIAVGP